MSTRQRSSRTPAFILRQQAWGEADRLLTLFTPQQGKIRVVAKGVRRANSRRAGHLEAFTLSDVLLSQGRDLAILTQAESLESYRPLHEDLQRFAAASYVVELLDRLTVEAEPQPELFELLQQTLAALCQTEQIGLLLCYFELHSLAIAGFQPELQRCVWSGVEIEAVDQFFDLSAGGVVCPAASQQAAQQLTPPALLPITVQTLKLLRIIQRSHWQVLATLPVPAGTLATAELLLRKYTSQIITKTRPAADFLREMRSSYGQHSNTP